MAVGAQVLLAERLGQRGDRGAVERAVGQRHGQLERLARVAQVDLAAQQRPARGIAKPSAASASSAVAPPAPRTAASSSRGIQRRPCGGNRCARSGARRRRTAGRTPRTDPAPTGTSTRAIPSDRGQLDRVHRAVAAEGEQGVAARVAPALARDRAHGAHHVRVGDQVDAVGGLVESSVRAAAPPARGARGRPRRRPAAGRRRTRWSGFR